MIAIPELSAGLSSFARKRDWSYTFMSLKAKVEAIIYATEEPVTLNQLASLLNDAVLAELQAEEEARLAFNEVISDGTQPPKTPPNGEAV